MADTIIHLENEKLRWNQRWRFDPAFKKDFDYEKPEYADCPDDMRWLLPLAEHQKSPEFLAAQEASVNRSREHRYRIRREKFKSV